MQHATFKQFHLLRHVLSTLLDYFATFYRDKNILLMWFIHKRILLNFCHSAVLVWLHIITDVLLWKLKNLFTITMANNTQLQHTLTHFYNTLPQMERNRKTYSLAQSSSLFYDILIPEHQSLLVCKHALSVSHSMFPNLERFASGSLPLFIHSFIPTWYTSTCYWSQWMQAS